MSDDDFSASSNVIPLTGMRPPFDPQITTLWDDKRYKDDFRAKVYAILEADPDLWFIEVRDREGRELLMFRGRHP